MNKEAIEPVLDHLSPGFYRRLFLVPKKNGKLRPVIDLSPLNKMTKVDYFQMETAASVRKAIEPGSWEVSIDLKDAYLHIPIHKAFRKFLRFTVDGEVFQFKSLPFGISTAPLVFTNLMEIVAAHIRKQSPRLTQYFDDWLNHSSQGRIFGGPPSGIEIHNKIGFNSKCREIGTNSVPRFCVYRNEFPHRSGASQSSRRQSKQYSPSSILNLPTSSNNCKEVFDTTRNPQIYSGPSSFGTFAHEATSVLYTGPLETPSRQFGPPNRTGLHVWTSPEMVDEPKHLQKGYSFGRPRAGPRSSQMQVTTAGEHT